MRNDALSALEKTWSQRTDLFHFFPGGGFVVEIADDPFDVPERGGARAVVVEKVKRAGAGLG